MVITDEKLMYRNVAWDSYTVHYTEFDKAIEEFNHQLVAAELTINGPLFYALHNVPLDEMMYVDICIPVVQSNISSESDLKFQTYYYIDQMIRTRIIGDFASETEFAYEKLFTFSLLNNLQIASPIFHILRGDDEVQWVDLKVKVFEPEENEPDHRASLLDKYSRK